MYPQYTNFVAQEHYDRNVGGLDSFSRVMGRDHLIPRSKCGCSERFCVRNLNRGYDRSGGWESGRCDPCNSAHRHFSSPSSIPAASHSMPVGSGSSPMGASRAPYPGKIIDEEPLAVQYGERTVKKLVQVPIKREVRVPEVVEKVVETTEVREFPVRRAMQEQAYRTVQEDFVDYEDRSSTRMKDVWVKQQVPERYVERVPVPRSRAVDIPYTKLREYTDVERVEVPAMSVIEEPGYRVDQLVEHETHEVEGRQTVQWIPRVVGDLPHERDLGARDRQVVDHKVGRTIYPESCCGNGRSADAFVDSRGSCPAGYQAPPARPCGDNQFGLFVKESVIGLVVKSVDPCSAAADAGLAVGDVVHAVDGTEVFSVEEWRRAVSRKRACSVAYRSKRLGRNMTAPLSY